MSYYLVPTADKSLSSVRSTVLATGVSLFFMYLVHYGFQVLVTFVLDREEKEKNKIKQKLLQTSRVLYLFIVATIVSIYPPFYYGPHSAILSWITLIIIILMHIFCIVEKQCKERSVWSVIYMLYHLSIAIWITLVLIVGYTWSNKQSALPDE